MYIMCSGFSCASDTHGRSSGVERSATVLSRGFQWLLGDKTGLLSAVFPAVKMKLFWAAFVPPAWSKATPICLQLNRNVPRWEANWLTCLGLKQPPPHPTHKALNRRVWTDQSPGRDRWSEVQVKCAGLVVTPSPSQMPQCVGGVRASSVVTMQPSLLRQPRIHFPSFLRGLHTAWEGMKEKRPHG